MLSIRKQKADKTHLYRFTLECLGHSIEVGMSYDELKGVKAKGVNLLNNISKFPKKLRKLPKVRPAT